MTPMTTCPRVLGGPSTLAGKKHILCSALDELWELLAYCLILIPKPEVFSPVNVEVSTQPDRLNRTTLQLPSIWWHPYTILCQFIIRAHKPGNCPKKWARLSYNLPLLLPLLLGAIILCHLPSSVWNLLFHVPCLVSNYLHCEDNSYDS